MNFEAYEMVGTVHTEQDWADCVRFDNTDLPKILIILSTTEELEDV